MVEHQIECIYCGEIFTVVYDPADYDRWKNGELIQNAFPYLSAEDRELIKTGICGNCWDKMFEF